MKNKKEDDPELAEAAFAAGLSNCCPRCGIELADLGEDETQFQHLRNCNDTFKHAFHAGKKAQAAAEKAEKERKKKLQEELAIFRGSRLLSTFYKVRLGMRVKPLGDTKSS